VLQLIGELRFRESIGLEVHNRSEDLSRLPRLERLDLDVEETAPSNGMTIGLEDHGAASRRTISQDVPFLATENAEGIVSAVRLEVTTPATLETFTAANGLALP
jgi:hypothetical protein